MKSRVFLLLASALALFEADIPLQAAYTINNGQIMDANEVATMPVEEHFKLGAKAFENDRWADAACQFRIIAASFPATAYGQEAYFYLGVCYFNLTEYDFANESLTDYLKCQSNPRFFQEVMEYKFAIAEKFAGGAKRRFFGTKQLPKWACGKDMAVEIYDEVVAAVPCHDIAAQSLISKGCLLWSMRDYQGAIESFQLVIRRFPKHELSPECYVLIGKVYLEQCWYEFQNPDLIAFAEINLNRFERDFPREDRVCEVQQVVREIKEIYAQGLYGTGRFYERTRHPRAAIIYYHNAIHQFPDTSVAELCRERLLCLDSTYSAPYEDSADTWEEELEEEEPRSLGTIEHREQLSGS